MVDVPHLFENRNMATRLDRFVDKSYDLQRHCAVSNACGFVSGLLYYFLKAVGEPVELEYGLKEVYSVLPSFRTLKFEIAISFRL